MFANLTDDIKKIHNYYLCKARKCKDICKEDKENQKSKDKKFQHKWLNDPTLAKCHQTGIWSLSYVEGLGMFCALCCMNNTSQPTNDSKVWNSEPNIRYRTETVRGHLTISEEKSMHKDAVTIELMKKDTYFISIETEKK